MKYLLSYPRSGSNLLKYYIQTMTRFQIHDLRPEDNIKILNTDFLKNHAHLKNFWDAYQPQNDNVILIIRNYKECIPRHLENIDHTFTNLTSNIDGETFRNGNLKADYIKLLDIFDKNPNPKLLVYYEDLLIDPKSELKKIYDFLINELNAIDNVGYDNTIENLDVYRNRSLNNYVDNIGASKTLGQSILHHSNKLELNTKIAMDNYLLVQHEYLTRKYLTPYFEKNYNQSFNPATLDTYDAG